MASTSSFALAVTKKGNESCRVILKDIVDLVPKHPNSTAAKADSLSAANKCNLIRTRMNDASSASATANAACKKLTEDEELVKEGTKEATEEDTKKMLEADAARKLAIGAAIEVQDVYVQVKRVKYKLKREIMEADFKARDAALQKLIADEEVRYLNITTEIAARIKQLEEEIAKLPNATVREKLDNETATLTELLAREQHKYLEVQKAQNSWIEEVTDENDFGKRMDMYNYQLASAESLDAWLEDYRQLLQSAIPKFLMDMYNTTIGGCLDADFEDYFNVTVEIVQVEDRNKTLIDKCKSPLM